MARDQVFYKWGAGVGASLPKVDQAYDEFLVTDDGEEIIDAAAGAAVVNLGHSVSGIEDVVREQVNEVSYISLTKFTHDKTERLAGKLREMAPGDLDTSFFTNSGSEANELSFKLARKYHERTGSPHKNKIISRWQSYHGATLGALSASGNTSRRGEYAPQLLNWPHITPAYPYRWHYEGEPEEQARAAAAELERTIKQEGSDTVAAFIAEPVSGASIPAAHPHTAYYEEVRRICDDYDVLFIADEVMSGFGRTGELFGVEHYDVLPDMITVGKGLAGGYTPLSAVIVNDPIAQEFANGSGGKFNHGHTHSGNPMSAAIGLHVANQYDDDLLDEVRNRGEQLRNELTPIEDHEMVGEIRQIGLMVGVEFVSDRSTKEPFDPELKINKRVFREAMDRGVYLYPGSGSVDGVAGDHVMLSPPLTVSRGSVSEIAHVVRNCVEEVYESFV